MITSGTSAVAMLTDHFVQFGFLGGTTYNNCTFNTCNEQNNYDCELLGSVNSVTARLSEVLLDLCLNCSDVYVLSLSYPRYI